MIKGAYGVFAVTNFWEKFSADVEEAQGKAIADVCKVSNRLLRMIRSGSNAHQPQGRRCKAPRVEQSPERQQVYDRRGAPFCDLAGANTKFPVSKGALPAVHHFDGKANVEDYIRSLGIPASFFLAGFYMSNLPGASLREMPDGKWGLALPIPDDSPIPLFDTANDTGKFVKAMFLNEQKVLGKRVYGATAYYTPSQILQEFKELYPSVGKDAGYSQLPGDVFKGILAATGAPEVIQEEMLQNMRLMLEFGYYGGDSLDFSLGVKFFLRNVHFV